MMDEPPQVHDRVRDGRHVVSDSEWDRQEDRRRFFSVKELADLCCVSTDKIYDDINKGVLASYDVGGLARIRYDAALGYMRRATTPATEDDPLFTVKEVADAWAVHIDTVRRYIKKGALQAIYVGPRKRVRIAQSELRRFGTAEMAGDIPDPTMTLLPSGVYVLRWQELVKIGASKRIGARLNSLRATYPFAFEVVAIVRTREPFELETNLHAQFAEYRVKGDWYRAEPLLIEQLRSMQEAAPTNTHGNSARSL